jgi:ABC-type phosphate transport system substrate-binding protein
MRYPFLLMTVAAVFLAWSSPARAENPNDILVIVNPSVPVKSVSVQDLKDLFLKKRLDWGSGGKAVPIHAAEGSSLRTAFVRRVIGMSVAEEQSYWQERKIKAGIDKPTEFANPLKAVFKIKGAVSYVFRSMYKEGVAKVVMVLAAE